MGFDPAAGAFYPVTGAGAPRTGAAVASKGRDVLVAGGERAGAPTGESQLFDGASWTFVAWGAFHAFWL